MTISELTYFDVTGHWYDIEAPITSGSTNQPQFLVVSGFVNFTPRLAPGTQVYVENLDLGTSLTTPTGLAVTGHGTGGTFAAGQYYWVVTAVNANGETMKSSEVTATFTGSTSSAVLTWNAVDEATNYKLYRGTSVSGENVLVTTVDALTYTDTGASGTSASPPGSNTAIISANTSISIAPVQARIWEGALATIDRTDAEGVQLLANTEVLGLTNPLIYDVSFSNVVYASQARVLSNFAFTAPTSDTPIDLSDPDLTRLQYNPTDY
jgi:hypothetical protein